MAQPFALSFEHADHALPVLFGSCLGYWSECAFELFFSLPPPESSEPFRLFLTVLGGYLADVYLGKHTVIVLFSMLYTFGLFLLAAGALTTNVSPLVRTHARASIDVQLPGPVHPGQCTLSNIPRSARLKWRGWGLALWPQNTNILGPHKITLFADFADSLPPRWPFAARGCGVDNRVSYVGALSWKPFFLVAGHKITFRTKPPGGGMVQNDSKAPFDDVS